jgi:hypothetical protein
MSKKMRGGGGAPAIDKISDSANKLYMVCIDDWSKKKRYVESFTGAETCPIGLIPATKVKYSYRLTPEGTIKEFMDYASAKASFDKDRPKMDPPPTMPVAQAPVPGGKKRRSKKKSKRKTRSLKKRKTKKRKPYMW